jgi:hypothetical protein
MDLDALPLVGDLLKGAGWASGYMVLVWVLIRHNAKITRGDLVPRKTHEDALTTIALQNARLDLQAESGRDMADALETVQQFIGALPRDAGPVRRPTKGVRS